MRVIEPDDFESLGASRSSGFDVRPGIDQKSCRALREISRSNGFGDVIGGSEKDAATLARLAFPGVGDHSVGHRRSHRHRQIGYNASTAIAMPMPPPMHR